MTYSVVLAVPAAGLLGAATASCSLGVGNAVPAVRPGVGAVVSQAWTNRSLRGRLLDALVEGDAPDQALAGLPGLDPDHAIRQLAVVDARGGTAVHTGSSCSSWAGAVPVVGGGAVGTACANLVHGAGVVEAMAAAVNAHPAPTDAPGLANLLLAMLQAGEAAGGDVRGQQSAAMLVGQGAEQGWCPPDLEVDLRVDDHPEPLVELARLLALLTPPTA